MDDDIPYDEHQLRPLPIHPCNGTQNTRSQKLFRFEETWIANEEFGEIVWLTWMNGMDKWVLGGIHSSWLGSCRSRLKRWSRNRVINNRLIITELQGNIRAIHGIDSCSNN